MLQVAVGCGKLQWVVASCSTLWQVAVRCGKLQCVVASCSALWQVAVRCGKLQWVVASCSALLQVAVRCGKLSVSDSRHWWVKFFILLLSVVGCCSCWPDAVIFFATF